jgi:hypothetical protein
LRRTKTTSSIASERIHTLNSKWNWIIGHSFDEKLFTKPNGEKRKLKQLTSLEKT